jgi:malonyl-CoA/methylmalonyl-CoA synthetase
MTNAYDYFTRAALSQPGRPFLETADGRVYSYGDLEEATARAAAALLALGLAPGDRVAVQVEKSPEALFLYLGCLRAGLCYLPLNTAYRAGELGYFLADAQPRAVVCAPQALDTFTALAGTLAHSPTLLTLDEHGAGTWPSAAAAARPMRASAVATPDTLAVIIYTSGTTGRSKGAMVTHGNLTSNAAVLRDAWRFKAQDVLLHMLPFFHVHGLFVALHPILLAGARLLFHARFDAREALAALPRATVMMGVPTFYVRLLAERGLDRAAAAGMRLFVSGSAPLLTDTFAQFRARTGHAILERYGMSEAGMITSNPYDGERRPGSVGFPLPGVALRVRDGERECPPGEPGVIEIRGPNVFAGYWRMPERTREELTPDGWFRTGDVGEWSGDGYLAIVGRAKDLIISGGFNVYPKEIELVIDAMPGVLESAVVGVPHADFGEAVTAFVVRRPGAAIGEPEVIAHVKDRLAGFKVPKRVLFLEDLPRNAMGKVQKNALRERLRAAP